MLMRLRIAAALSMAALLSLAVGGTGAIAAPSGQNNLPVEVLQYEWVLEYFNTDAKAAGQDVTSHQITISFAADGTLSGFGGCNDYSGSYTVSGQTLQIGQNLISTQKACEEAVMNNESLYFRLLSTVNAYALNQFKLDLIYEDGHNAMTFIPGEDKAGQRDASALPAEVRQTEWLLRYFDNKAGLDVGTAGITINFDALALSGFAGCNSYNGVYRVSGQQLTIGDNLSTTRMACPAGPTALESRYLSLLPTVKSYTATISELQLVYGDDGSALIFVPNGPHVMPVPAPAPAPAPAPPAAPAPGMPTTGGGESPLMLLVLLGSLVALSIGFALRIRGRSDDRNPAV